MSLCGAALVMVFMTIGGQPVHGQMFIGLGTNQLDASGLNSVLQAKGIPAVPETYLTFGAGGHGTIGDVYIGGGGYKISGFTAANNAASASISGGGYGFFDIGYVPVQTEQWRGYTYASLGGGQVDVSVVKGRGESGDPSVSGVLENPGTSVDYSIGTLLLGGTVGVEYEIPKIYVRLALEAGYRYSPTSPGWTSNGIEVENPPDVDLGGPFVRVNIGGNAGALTIGEVLGGILAN